MENASKAIIIAGVILIVVFTLSIGVILVNNLKNTSDEYVAKLDLDELNKYNSMYTVFINRNNVKPHEIVTVIGNARELGLNMKVYVDGAECVQGPFDSNAFLTSNIYYKDSNEKEYNIFKYKKNSIKYKDGKVIEISFERVQ